MADDLERPGGDAEHEAPPHAAPPSIWPFAFALGIAVALIGLVISWPVAAIGGAIALVFGFLWIRDATRRCVTAASPPDSTNAAPPPRKIGRRLQKVTNCYKNRDCFSALWLCAN